MFGLTITASKLSTISLYRRIFVTERFQQVSLVVGGLCVVWWIFFTVMVLVPCLPVQRFWMRRRPGQCYNINQFALSISAVDVFLDALILVLPIKPILDLQMSKSRKALLCAIFLVGGL